MLIVSKLEREFLRRSDGDCAGALGDVVCHAGDHQPAGAQEPPTLCLAQPPAFVAHPRRRSARTESALVRRLLIGAALVGRRHLDRRAGGARVLSGARRMGSKPTGTR